jgi:4-hydroxy-4-methyl-2-oxoglutarate aldolase
MSATVYLRAQRLPRTLTAAARRCSVSDLHEVLQSAERARATMSPRMRPLVPGLRMAGSAITVQPARGDNLMMHRALKLASRGDVLVVAARGGPGAQWGELAAVYGRRIGLAGVVVHGPIRDVDALRALRFPVWATEIAPSHPDKKGAGNVNAAVNCD